VDTSRAGADIEDEPQTPPPAAAPRKRTLRRALGIGAPLVLIVAVFGFALPRLASYSQVLDTLRTMTTTWIAVIALAGLANLLANWILITSALPGLSLPRAAAANLASTAVANTVPGGGAISLGISWRMLTGWGVTSGEFAAYAGVTGVWSALAKLATPGVAVLILAFSGRLSSGVGATTTLLVGALISLGVFTVAVLVLRRGLHDERAAQAVGRGAQRSADRVFRILRRPAPTTVAATVVRFRDEAQGLLRERGRRLTLATVASDLGWLVVLQSCLLACGVSQAEVSWSRCFAGFALARLISTIPITPGGLGVIELGLTTYLASGLDPAAAARVTTAVLLTRAVTFALPIPLGAVTYAGWHFKQVRDAVGGASAGG
jgi:putative heme transporter